MEAMHWRNALDWAGMVRWRSQSGTRPFSMPACTSLLEWGVQSSTADVSNCFAIQRAPAKALSGDLFFAMLQLQARAAAGHGLHQSGPLQHPQRRASRADMRDRFGQPRKVVVAPRGEQRIELESCLLSIFQEQESQSACNARQECMNPTLRRRALQSAKSVENNGTQSGEI